MTGQLLADQTVLGGGLVGLLIVVLIIFLIVRLLR